MNLEDYRDTSILVALHITTHMYIILQLQSTHATHFKFCIE